MTEEEARQIVGSHTTDELRAIAAALSIRPAENTDEGWKRLEAACLLLGYLAPVGAVAALKAHKALRGVTTSNAVWNDRIALYCLCLILSRGDATVPDTHVPGYLRFQVQAARLAGQGDIADALATAADAYAQGHHGLAYSILLSAIGPLATPEA